MTHPRGKGSFGSTLPKQPGGRGWLAIALLLYNLALLLALPAAGIWLLWRMVARGKGMGSWRHRLGLVPRPRPGARPRVWLHAVSAGEMGAIKPVLDALRRRLPGAQVVVSTVTQTGMAVGQQSCGSADALFYLPLEFLPTMALAMLRVRPELVVVAEKELWPNLLGIGRLLGARTLVVNGRVSDRMMRRAAHVKWFVRWLYHLPERFCAQSNEDAARLARLGVAGPRVSVAGNTKADGMAARDEEAEERLRRSIGAAPDEHWLVAGSTHPGEEEAVAEAFLRIRQELPRARLLIAPRHLERAAAVCDMLKRRGLPFVKRSEGTSSDASAVVILDTMGELRAAYGVAAVTFVGGTLVPIGGHNLLEPVAAGRAVLFGPHTENCADVADLVLKAGIGFRVRNAEAFAQEFVRIARDAARRNQIASRGRALIEQQRGAAERCAEAAVALLGAGQGRP
jgi:3-deoxy-D-manno-octulosonic-acid transferase